MQKGGRQTSTRDARVRRSIAGAIVLTVLIAAAIVYYPRGLRGPETVATEFLYALIRAPEDAARLRTAGHLAQDDDPLALADGLPTRIALAFLAARSRQGVTHEIDVTERRPAEQGYVAVLAATERANGDAASVRRFIVALRQTDTGDWRVTAIGAAD